MIQVRYESTTNGSTFGWNLSAFRSMNIIASNGMNINAALTSYTSPGKKSILNSNINVKISEAKSGVTDSRVANKLKTLPNSSFWTNFDSFERMAIDMSPETAPIHI